MRCEGLISPSLVGVVLSEIGVGIALGGDAPLAAGVLEDKKPVLWLSAWAAQPRRGCQQSDSPAERIRAGV